MDEWKEVRKVKAAQLHAINLSCLTAPKHATLLFFNSFNNNRLNERSDSTFTLFVSQFVETKRKKSAKRNGRTFEKIK